jgi:NADH dehydrogenase
MGQEVRVVARSAREVPGVELVTGDITDPTAVGRAVSGCSAVIHLVGIIREKESNTFRRVHVQGTETVVAACREHGVRRLLHMSALGAREAARSRYHRSKWRAEGAVLDSGLATTIFRPSLIFGQGSAFIAQLRDLVSGWPVVPVIGDGMSLTQPIWVEDVVSCFLAALGNEETIGQAYELGGPEALAFEQLLDVVAEAEGIDTVKAHLPLWLVKPVTAVLGRLSSRFPLTPDSLAMLTEDNVCDIEVMRRTFGLEPARLGEHLSD